MIGEYRIGKDVEGTGRGLVEGTVPTFAWKDPEIPRNFSFRVVSIPSGIRTRHFPSTKSEVLPLGLP
jgi:hypothetical protein